VVGVDPVHPATNPNVTREAALRTFIIILRGLRAIKVHRRFTVATDKPYTEDRNGVLEN
jgi:hypothetical protein